MGRDSDLPCFPPSIRLVDVGLRDGLQGYPKLVSTDTKVRIAGLLLSCGFAELEVASFAHPSIVPQMADAREVMAALPRSSGTVFRALVPNLKGAQRALECGVDEMMIVIPCDDDLSRANQNRTVRQLLDELASIATLAAKADVRVSVGLGVAFFTPGKGVTPPANVLEIVQEVVDVGVRKMYLASSTGMAEPRQIFELVAQVRNIGQIELGLHLHSRNGLGLANAMAGLQAGVDWIEGSILGLGGDPWLLDGEAGALGNVPMEDLVHFMHLIGVETDIDLPRYLEVCSIVEKMLGCRSTSFVLKGGRREDLSDIPGLA